MLYSRKDSVWKLADFGFTSEGSSRTLQTSDDRRGTSGYRAPELLTFVYNNKVDIWSMGCILYELAVGKKTFNSDYVPSEYQIPESTLQTLDDNFGDPYKETITANIALMLQIDSTLRPSAMHLLQEFSRNFQSTPFQPHYSMQIQQDFREILESGQTPGILDELVSSIHGNQ